MKTEMKRNLEQYVHHKVVDQNGDKIGTLQCLWSDQESEPVYLGVQTGWLFGKTHIVPAERVEVNESARTIRLPYTVQKVKDAPSFDSKCEIDPNTEREVRSYYNMISPAAGTASQAPGRSQEAASVQLHEEQIKIGKRQVEAGGVRLRKIIRAETINQPVELQREEIVVEHVPGKQTPQASQGKDFQQEEIYIPLRREEAVV